MEPNISPIALGWAQNSVNAVVFRHNSVVTFQDTQYVAFYDAEADVVLAKRQLGTHTWDIRRTPYQGNVQDAHNTISIMVDGDGFLHMSWDQHNQPLRYCRSRTPGSLALTDRMVMTGSKEDRVTYPEFYRLPHGDLLFVYRDGASGQGNVMMNYYDLKTKTWSQRQDAFISGEGRRSAYWQVCTDTTGTIHISWIWRESADVATNHDIGYARSADGAKTWSRSNGEEYSLPITESTAEYACRIPQNRGLINTTSMGADDKGHPYIATYWQPPGTEVPQYHMVYHDGAQWRVLQVTRRTTPFHLSGGGTKRIPMSRPQLVVDCRRATNRAYMIFRDVERGDRVSLAVCEDLQKGYWHFQDLTEYAVDMWEPSYDTELWSRSKVLHIFVQQVKQGDTEQTEYTPPTMVSILEWIPD